MANGGGARTAPMPAAGWRRVLSRRLDSGAVVELGVSPYKSYYRTGYRKGWRCNGQRIREDEAIPLLAVDAAKVRDIQYAPPGMLDRFREAVKLVEEHRLLDALAIVQDAVVELAVVVKENNPHAKADLG